MASKLKQFDNSIYGNNPSRPVPRTIDPLRPDRLTRGNQTGIVSALNSPQRENDDSSYSDREDYDASRDKSNISAREAVGFLGQGFSTAKSIHSVAMLGINAPLAVADLISRASTIDMANPFGRSVISVAKDYLMDAIFGNPDKSFVDPGKADPQNIGIIQDPQKELGPMRALDPIDPTTLIGAPEPDVSYSYSETNTEDSSLSGQQGSFGNNDFGIGGDTAYA